jgi:hypothetical protein
MITRTRKIGSLIATILALAFGLAFSGAEATAGEIDASQIVRVDPKVLSGERDSPLRAQGYQVIHVQENAETFAANNLQTQCISNNLHMTWYGMKAGECKHADASGAQFTVFNSSTGKAVAHVDLTKVKEIQPDSSINLGCVASAAGLALTLTGSPASVVGWVQEGVSALLGVVGIVTSC